MSIFFDFCLFVFLCGYIVDMMVFYYLCCIDLNGGFFYYFWDDGSIYDVNYCYLVSSMCFVFNYVMVYCEFGNVEYCEVVEYGVCYLCEVYCNLVIGGYVWILCDGKVEDDMNYCYGVVFVLLVYSCVLKVGFEQVCVWMDEIWQLLEVCFWELQYGFYKDEVDGQWNFIGYCGQNVNMYMCEVMLVVFEVSGEQCYVECVLQLVDNMICCQVVKVGGLVWEYYDFNWEIDWDYNLDDFKYLFCLWGFQLGYQIEWVKLLLILDCYVQVDWLVLIVQYLFDVVVVCSWDEVWGGLYYGFVLELCWQLGMDGVLIGGDSFVCDDDKYFWVQVEMLVIVVLMVKCIGDDCYWQWYQCIWVYLWEYFVDYWYGVWFCIFDVDNCKYSDEKSLVGKVDYYIMGVCYEVLNVVC